MKIGFSILLSDMQAPGEECMVLFPFFLQVLSELLEDKERNIIWQVYFCHHQVIEWVKKKSHC